MALETTIIDKSNPTNFQLVFPLVPGASDINANNELTLNIFNTVIPSVGADIQQSNWQGAVVPFAAGGTTFDNWNVRFVVDEQLNNWRLLFTWFTFINNNKDKYLDHFDDYVVDGSLKILDNFEKTIFSITVKNLWPISIDSVELDYRNGESNLECGATFAYTYYEL